jgi:hypothetical protein
MRTAALLILLLPAGAFCADTGTTALPFLKMDQGARAAALGGAYTAAGDDAWAVFYNPASAALLSRQEIVLGHNEWLQGLRNEAAAYVRPLPGGGALFGGMNMLFSGSMDKYDVAGVNTGSFNSQEGALNLGASLPLGGGFYGGAAAKALYQKAASMSAMAWAGDAGLLKVEGDWRVGAAISNFGTGMKLAGTAFPLPLMLRSGVSWHCLEPLTLSADGIKAGESPASGALGAEGKIVSGPDSAFFLRAGYRTGRSQYAGSGVSVGLGIKNEDLRLDYAFTPYGELGDSHRITLALAFGGERKRVKKAPAQAPKPIQKIQPVKTAPAKTTPAKKSEAKPKEKNGDSSVYFMW